MTEVPISSVLVRVHLGRPIPRWEEIFIANEISTLRGLLQMEKQDLDEMFEEAKEPFKKAALRAL